MEDYRAVSNTQISLPPSMARLEGQLIYYPIFSQTLSFHCRPGQVRYMGMDAGGQRLQGVGRRGYNAINTGCHDRNKSQRKP